MSSVFRNRLYFLDGIQSGEKNKNVSGTEWFTFKYDDTAKVMLIE